MSIWLYTGTPGSGKSYHAARDIVARLRCGGGLICNFPVNAQVLKRCRVQQLVYWDNSELTAQRLIAFARKYLKVGVEGQCLVVIDECQIIFNSRDYNRKDRMAWIQLFCQHRKLGFNFILITQNDRMIDRQIRALVENEVKHRKLNNYGLGGKIFGLLTLGKTWFIAIDYWYGGNKLKLGQEIFPYNRKFEKVYDSYRLFSDMSDRAGDEDGDGDRTGCPLGRGPGVAPAPIPAPAEAEQPSITSASTAPSLPPPDTSTPGFAVGSDLATPCSRQPLPGQDG